MKLSKLLTDLEYVIVQGSVETEISKLVYDSRLETMEEGVFVCIKGNVTDGHQYAQQVVDKGAKAIVVEEDIHITGNATIIRVKNTRKALSLMAAAYFDYPAKKLKTIGITGTKGKTTTAYMVHSMLELSGIKTGLIGTIGILIGSEMLPSNNTTPESYLVQQYFSQMVEQGCKCVVMEVSSQGLMQYRVGGITFDYGIFTNLERDHIGPGEHKSFEEYAACKGQLFKQCKVGIVNTDDKHWTTVLQGHTCQIETFGTKDADLTAVNINLHSEFGNLGVTYDLRGLLNFKVKVDIPGKFSVYNSLTAIAICRHFDISEEKIKEALLSVKVRGRVEPVMISNHFSIMIDYAHNAMSLNSVLSTLKEYNPKRLVCVFGCGGNRSKDRRYEMGEISSNMADLTIVTSDNPRFEEPEAILQDIIVGVKRGKGKYIAICDRKEAIRYSILNAQENDVILIAGKGHEDYQEIKGVKYKMDDRQMIYDIVNEMTEEQKNKLK